MNSDIFPCLWFAGNAEEAAEFYTKIFSGNITVNMLPIFHIEIFGQKIMLLNGGSQFQKNPSISLMITCSDKIEVQKYWNKLSENGTPLMPLDSYPWSKKYGWIQDKFGVSWQFYLAENSEHSQKLVPTLMFINENKGKAQKAMDFYTQTFPNSKIGNVLKYGENENNEPAENVQHADFSIDGYTLYCMDSSFEHQFNFNEGISMIVMTNTQQQTNFLWDSLISEGGKESMCGWLKDRFGLSWQIIPKKLIELLNDKNPDKVQKAQQALMKMKKIVIADLEV
ncbi:MAG: VOC family protein [Flavobacteriaceae bacterium]|jgi:predicted 3-demethylubiquinone-9 3-methyltransferase (glyoxalase superfamily)|nr:VOC family protein [Flavobacteriaceae bacterium]